MQEIFIFKILKKTAIYLGIILIVSVFNRSFGQGSVSSLSKDKTVQVNGKPIFLNGIYYNGLEFTAEQRRKDLDLFKSIGMNMIEACQINWWPDHETFFDDAAKRGILLTCEVMFDSTGKDLAFISKYKNKSAVIGWNSADDSHRQFTVEGMRARNNKVKALDPSKLSYQTVYKPTISLPYLPLTDMVWPYTYPVHRGKSGDDFINVQNLMDSLTTMYPTAYVGIPQAYNWAMHDSVRNANCRFPDPVEYRNFVYQYLVYGTKGILPYSFTDAGRLPDVAPDLWASIVKSVNELNTLTPALINGKFNRIATGDKFLQASYWEHDKNIYLVLVNISNSGNTKFSLKLPFDKGIKLNPLFDPSKSTCELKNGSLVGTIYPMDAKVYLLN